MSRVMWSAVMLAVVLATACGGDGGAGPASVGTDGRPATTGPGPSSRVSAATDVVSDDFERPALGSDWAVDFGDVAIIAGSDLGLRSEGPIGLATFMASPFSSDQFSQARLAAGIPEGMLTMVSVRKQAGNPAARYGFTWDGDPGDEQWILKFDGVPTPQTRILAATRQVPRPQAGDVLRIEVRGSAPPRVVGLLNGQVVLTAEDRGGDAIRSGGRPALAFRLARGSSTRFPTPVFADWQGGDLDGSPSPQPSDGAITRLDGKDRIATAVRISQAGFPQPASAAAVVIARSDRFPDALAGAPLAALRSGPLLLTPTDALADESATEIQRVLADQGTVFVLGGTAALSTRVDDALRALGRRTVRVSGRDRIATSLAIAEELGDPDLLLLVAGHRWPDAAVAGAAAAARGGAVILVTTDGVTRDPAAEDYLVAALPRARAYAVGGGGVNPYAGDGRLTQTVSGTGREATAVAMAEVFFGEERVIGLARRGLAGDDADSSFADALTGGPHVAALGGPMLLTDGARLSPVTAGYVCRREAELTGAIVFGGLAAVGTNVLNELSDRISGAGC